MWVARGHPPVATSHYPLASENRLLSRPDQTYRPTPHPCTMGLTSISQRIKVFRLESPHGLHSHSCGLQCPLGRQLPKAGTAGKIPAGVGYPYLGDSSRKLSFLDTFRTPVAPNLECSRNTHPCGMQGSSAPSNFPLPTSSRKSTFVQARPNLPPNPSPMHNGFDLDFPRNQSFPAGIATWATFPFMWSTMPTWSPTPESGHSWENTSRSRISLFRRNLAENYHFSTLFIPQ